MSWYTVTKRIRGKPYLYRQRSWREGGKVKTQTQCLGPITGGSAPLTNTNEDPDGVYTTPFGPRNTTSVITSGPVSELITSRPIDEPEWFAIVREQKRELERLAQERAKQAKEPSDPMAGTWWPRNTTKKRKSPLAEYKISRSAIANEYEAVARVFDQLGIDRRSMPSVIILRGKKTPWHKALFKRNTYVVTLQETGGRTKFKQAYREALADIWISAVKKKDKALYQEIMDAAGKKRKGRLQEVRALAGNIMRLGTEKGSKFYRKEVRARGRNWAGRQFTGVAGYRLAEVMKKHGF